MQGGKQQLGGWTLLTNDSCWWTPSKWFLVGGWTTHLKIFDKILKVYSFSETKGRKSWDPSWRSKGNGRFEPGTHTETTLKSTCFIDLLESVEVITTCNHCNYHLCHCNCNFVVVTEGSNLYIYIKCNIQCISYSTWKSQWSSWKILNENSKSPISECFRKTPGCWMWIAGCFLP